MVAIAGGDFEETIFGSFQADLIYPRGGDDVVHVGSGDDQITEFNFLGDTGFGSGSDIYYCGDGDDLISSADGDDVQYGGAGVDNLYGGVGDDVHDGGAGADVMAGRAGDDAYFVDDAGDAAFEFGGGFDWVYSTVSFALSDGIENLTLWSGGLTGSGNGLDNKIFGVQHDAPNRLFGYGGNDLLKGGAGYDELHGGDGDDALE